MIEHRTEPIVAYRAWRVIKPHYLVDLGIRGLWQPYERHEAECGSGHKHESPDEHCSCGIYAATDAQTLSNLGYHSNVLGEVYLWGKVIPGETAHRAQYAYPKSLMVVEDPRATDGQQTVLAMKLSLAYGIPCTVGRPPDKQAKDEENYEAPRRRRRGARELLKETDMQLERAYGNRAYIVEKIKHLEARKARLLNVTRGDGIVRL